MAKSYVSHLQLRILFSGGMSVTLPTPRRGPGASAVLVLDRFLSSQISLSACPRDPRLAPRVELRTVPVAGAVIARALPLLNGCVRPWPRAAMAERGFRLPPTGKVAQVNYVEQESKVKSKVATGRGQCIFLAPGPTCQRTPYHG